MRFSDSYHLNRHKDLHLDEKKYKCSHCPKSFQQHSGLAEHLKRHFKSQNQTQCFLCGQFFSRRCINKHIRHVHEGLRLHACPKCDKTFKTRAHLKYHLKTHENSKGRKRGLNKTRDVRVRREPNKYQAVLPVEIISETGLICENSEEAVAQSQNPSPASQEKDFCHVPQSEVVAAPTAQNSNEAGNGSIDLGLGQDAGVDYQWVFAL